ncbi:septal ring lytic transglycosylase RlpA family protein [Nevskia sp.]|uniref:septal ring lytic transglycosylase RlpA family protein n=1 Tax=Nevskia sp. TaxID=1929292 RepID=UPI0025EEFBE5|nr:septal ring lytic transglycosylase RlpA family protein [Nevskia sp.]
MTRLRIAGLLAVAAIATGCAPIETVPERPYERPTVHPIERRPPVAKAQPAPADEKDYAPKADEIPPDLASIPDAVPQPLERSPYGNPDSYEVFGVRYEILQNAAGFKERGHASWYGKKFHGRRTSSGDKYDMFAMTAAHKLLPIPSFARITNTSNGKSVIVKINDRGPFHPGRIVDLSYAAALKLDIINHGSAEVELEVVDPSGNTLVADTAPAPARVPAKPATAPARAVPAVESPNGPPGGPVSVANRPAHFLQAGVFSDSRNASNFREKLALAGVKPLVMKSESRNGRWVYRVLIGPFPNTGTLEKTRARMTADGTPTLPVFE